MYSLVVALMLAGAVAVFDVTAGAVVFCVAWPTAAFVLRATARRWRSE